MSSPPHSITRRVPPPCWTHDETLALIEAYRDKWYSVDRSNLRAPDWDAVASAVAESSSAHPPKLSLQCRHKIEKLRKRYREEKQRCLNFRGRFSSSWDLFPLLDAMSFGFVGSKKSQDIDEGNEIGERYQLKTLGNRYLVGPNKFSNVDQDVGLDPELAFRARKFSRGDEESQSSTARVSGNGFCAKPVGDVNSVSVAFRPTDYDRLDGKFRPVSRLGGSVVDRWGSPPPPPVSRRMSYSKVEHDSDVLDGIDDGLKKLNDPIEELVSAISVFTNTYVKVEKMKMEMAMEIEKTRMDMLLKHNQMILESQLQIVDAFAKASTGHSRKKRKGFQLVLLNGNSDFAVQR